MQLMEHQNLKDRRKQVKLQKSKSKQQAKRHGSNQKSRPGKANAIEIESKKKWSSNFQILTKFIIKAEICTGIAVLFGYLLDIGWQHVIHDC